MISLPGSKEFGMKLFLKDKKTADGLARFDGKYYYQRKDGRWMEQTETRETPEEEVPPHIRNRLGKRETDITQEVHEEMMKELTFSH